MNKQTSTKQPLTVGEVSKPWLFSEGQPVSPRPEPPLNCHDGTVTPLPHHWHPSWMRKKTNKGLRFCPSQELLWANVVLMLMLGDNNVHGTI